MTAQPTKPQINSSHISIKLNTLRKVIDNEKINIDEQIVNVEDVLGGGKTIDSEKTTEREEGKE